MRLILSCLLLFCTCCSTYAQQQNYGLCFNAIPTRWDEGIPLGNGWLGVMVWQKDNKLRLSLDRNDLWDDRPMADIDQLTFGRVKQQVVLKKYAPVQRIGDDPYSKYPAPSKIPGAAIEFDIQQLGKVVKDSLDIAKAINTITFVSGVRFVTYVHATLKAGFFCFEGIKTDVVPSLISPVYFLADGEKGDRSQNSLTRLGYPKATFTYQPGQIIFHQPTYGKNYYEVQVSWKKRGNKIEGSWTITNGHPVAAMSEKSTTMALHLKWWKSYWGRSSVSLPDQVLDRQYKLDMYKFGCVARSTTSPISLQAIWTVDNGSLPPWKGDLHHDLNTQMSYWPGYTANHLDLTASLTNWLWKVKEENRNWTKKYFNVDGLNVPGVSTISGKPMGGWIQYAMSPTTSAWLAHHFYLQWKYSMDDYFLKKRCYPYLAEVEKYLRNIMIGDRQNGLYQLPLSSSPEYNNNNLNAWFHKGTNNDLSLIHNLYLKFGEAARSNNLSYDEILKREKEIAPLDFNKNGLTIAPGIDLGFSHRHMSHLMAIYPLCLFNRNNPEEMEVMDHSMKRLEEIGTKEWYGFSFPWVAAIYAQMGRGDSAVVNLKKFAKNFCSSNSFNLNGDQKGGQYSAFTDRAFTLESNFGFAEGVHQLLLQSEHGYLDVFPAIPQKWGNVSFTNLRGQGAFLISAKRVNGSVSYIRVFSEKGGLCRIKIPFTSFKTVGISMNKIRKVVNGILEFQTSVGQTILLYNISNN